jgi:dolichol-phosphate mannosyltransferase
VKISAVIPVYNEEEVIDEFANRLTNSLRNLAVDYEAIFIVEGDDMTRDKLVSLSKQDPQIKVEYSEKRLGLGKALKKGLDFVDPLSDYVLTMDADLNHHPEEIIRLLDASKDADIVVGCRSKSQKGLVSELPFVKRLVSGGTNWILKKAFSVPSTDVTSGYRLYAAKKIGMIRDDIKGKNFEVQAEILIRAQKKGFSITEVPITFTRRPRGTSKLSFFRSGLGYVVLLLRLRN